MVRLGMMANEGDMDAPFSSIVISMFGGGEGQVSHAISVVKVWPEPRQLLPRIFESKDKERSCKKN